MYIRQVIILKDVEEKIWSKHNVSDDEINEIFDNKSERKYYAKAKR